MRISTMHVKYIAQGLRRQRLVMQIGLAIRRDRVFMWGRIHCQSPKSILNQKQAERLTSPGTDRGLSITQNRASRAPVDVMVRRIEACNACHQNRANRKPSEYVVAKQIGLPRIRRTERRILGPLDTIF